MGLIQDAGIPARPVVAASYPVGSIIQAPFGGLDPAKWLPCNGAPYNKAAFPFLAQKLPGIGVFTLPTIRAKGAQPTVAAIACDGTTFAASGPAGVNAIQTSTDMVGWTNRTTPAAFDCRALIWVNGNFIAMDAAGGSLPLYSPTGVTWNVATGAVTGAASLGQNAICYAPNMGASGRVCMAVGTASVYTSDDRGQTYTARATGLGANVFNVCWTGSYYVCNLAVSGWFGRSADGITWNAIYSGFPLTAGAAANTMVASDGSNSGAVACSNPAGVFGAALLVSRDHGAIWGIKRILNPLSGNAITSLSVISIANGRWWAHLQGSSWAVSADGVEWIYIADANFSTSGSAIAGVVAYKAPNYLSSFGNSTTNGVSWTEDLTQGYLPLQYASLTASATMLADQTFIRAAP